MLRKRRFSVGGALIAMAAAGQWLWLTRYPAWVDEALERCNEQIPLRAVQSASTAAGEVSCLTKLAVEAELPKLCEDISDDEPRWRCHAQVAATTHRPRQCRAIGDDDRRRACVEAAVPAASDPKSACANLDEPESGWCRWQAGSAWSSECSKLPETPPQRRYECLMHALDTFQFDDPIAACGGSVSCLSMLGERDIAVCQLIPPHESQAREKCLDRAVPSPNCLESYKSACQSLTDPALRETCIARDTGRAKHCIHMASVERGRRP